VLGAIITESAAPKGYGDKAPLWIPDNGVSMCQLCASTFKMLRRRHHCRICGKVVCGACSGHTLPIAYDNNNPGRVCVSCYTTVRPMDDPEPDGDGDEYVVQAAPLRARAIYKGGRFFSSLSHFIGSAAPHRTKVAYM